MNSLVGYTGFVGSNLKDKGNFTYLYNSQNIEQAFGTCPDLLVYSGVPAEKFLANQNPEKDLQIINNAIENIKKINPKKVVLISTVDVYPNPIGVDENSSIDREKLQPYGKNRLFLEDWVASNYSDYLIVRLPGLFGQNLKKNFIYDLISVIPSMLHKDKYNSLSHLSWIEANYSLQDNGFYKLNPLDADQKKELKKQFLDLGFSAINFTDSRGVFQFYNLAALWQHIQVALEANIRLINLATEPIDVATIYEALYHKPFKNEVTATVPFYDFRTIHAAKFGSDSNYLKNKETVLKEIISFIQEKTA